MRFHKTLTFFILATGLVFALSLWAQQKSVGPSSAGPWPNARRRHSGFGASATVRPYIACAAAMPSLPPQAQQKPFTQEQVASMVRDGFGDESGAKLIEQRGIDFAPSEDFIQTLKAAGASETFLQALRAAVAPGLSPAGNVAAGFSPAHAALKGASTTAIPPASAKKPLNQVQVFALLVGQVPSHRVTMLVQERGIDFEPTDDHLQEVRLAGGEDELISELKNAKVIKPATVDPAAEARQAQVRQHVARGTEYFQKRQYAQAEQEYRAALLLDSQNPDLYTGLAYVLDEQQRWDDAEYAAHEALRFDQDNDMVHTNLGCALANKGDWDGAIAESPEAPTLNPNCHLARVSTAKSDPEKSDLKLFPLYVYFCNARRNLAKRGDNAFAINY